MLIPILPELSEEVKEGLRKGAELGRTLYLSLLASGLVLGSINAVAMGGLFLRSLEPGYLAGTAVWLVAIGFAAREFADEVIEGEEGA